MGFQALRAENYKNNISLSFPRFYINILFVSAYIINITLIFKSGAHSPFVWKMFSERSGILFLVNVFHYLPPLTVEQTTFSYSVTVIHLVPM